MNGSHLKLTSLSSQFLPRKSKPKGILRYGRKALFSGLRWRFLRSRQSDEEEPSRPLTLEFEGVSRLGSRDDDPLFASARTVAMVGLPRIPSGSSTIPRIP